MSVKMSDALRESINDINEILYAQKLIDKKEYERVSAQFPMAAVSTEMDGRQFAQIRRKLNLSQAALGQLLGTSVSTISKCIRQAWSSCFDVNLTLENLEVNRLKIPFVILLRAWDILKSLNSDCKVFGIVELRKSIA